MLVCRAGAVIAENLVSYIAYIMRENATDGKSQDSAFCAISG
jgi:hypothetical protein